MADLDSIDGYPEKVENCPKKAYVYVLRLFSGRFYVGFSEHPKRRIVSHVRAEGTTPHWVKMYPPVGIEQVTGFDSNESALSHERQLTLDLARIHGAGRVRGGSWTAVRDAPPVEDL